MIPKGVFISVINAEAFLPIVCAVFTKEFANSSASCNDFIKAPVPHFTSNTKASEPSATFFDKMLAVIKGTDSTVPVTSLNAYKSLSAGTISSVCPIIAKPFSEMIFLNWSGDIFTLYPLIDSSLSRVPPVCPKALPLIIGICTPQEATIGASGNEILSPTPPVECLSTKGPVRLLYFESYKLITLPECNIVFVR